MRIRALTGFIDPGWPIAPKQIAAIATTLIECRDALQSSGLEVQTLRLATPPPAEMSQPVPSQDRVELARTLEAETFVQGLDYAAIGPTLPEELDAFAVIPQILAATEIVFASALIADPASGLSLSAAHAAAKVIHEASSISPDGFANLRFAALANVPAGAPFFPAAFHRGGSPAMAVATESANLAIEAIKDAASPFAARRHLVASIEDRAATISRIVRDVSEKHGVRYHGVDFSLAPFPEPERSLGTAIESFGVPAVGLLGTTAAASFLADCLDQAQFQRTGFCGLFLPVLEDSILAARAAEGQLTIADLLVYSTVCGTGLDIIPLPGDSSPESLAALLIDLGALSLRHLKPLTARLMPIPGKKAGDNIEFDFTYFTNSKVMDLPAQPLGGFLAGPGYLDIGPHTT